MKPRTINIFLLHGDPNGIRVAQILMSTIQAIAFRRNQLRHVREAFPEIERPGVYILIGTDEDAQQDRQLAYIGESEDVGARLSHHNSNGAGHDTKGFWTDTVVLISKDENLTKSHARYIEACLIRDAGSNPRWTLPNTQTPSDAAGKLPLSDRAAMDEFVDQAKTLVGSLGWDLYRDIPTAQATQSARFFIRGKGLAAEMEVGISGYFVVMAGSKAKIQTTKTIPRSASSLRKTLMEKGVLCEDQGFLIFTADCSFTSASAAAAIVTGSNVNGRTLWKLPDGRTYADWEAKQDATNPNSESS